MRISRFAFVIGSFVAVGIAAACSSPDTSDDSSGNPPDANAGDATSEAAGPLDGGGGDSATPVDAGACDLSKPFGAPTLIPGVNSPYAQLSPHVSEDELTIYFSSDRSDQGNASDDTDDFIYVATRTARTDSFTTPVIVSGGAGSGGSFQAMPSADQRELFFTSDQLVGPGGADLFVVSRAVTSSAFSASIGLAGINTVTNETGPFLRSDGQELWFSSDRAGNSDIYRAPLGADGGFSDPVAVAELNSASSDAYPYLSNDGLTIFFTSNRAGGSGGNDIWTAQRTSTTGSFDAPSAVTEINTSADELLGSLSADGCRIYFASSRQEDAGGLQTLLVAERPN